MERKSIFDIASASLNIANETDRIIKMAFKEDVVSTYKEYKLVNFVDERCFKDWVHRGHFLDLEDLLKAIDFTKLTIKAKQQDVDAFIYIIEIVYNCWMLAREEIKGEKNNTYWCGNFMHLKEVMDDNLEKYNHKAHIEKDRVLIIEDKPEVTAVAEIVEESLALGVIRYNHRSLQGEIEAKKQILLMLGAELEPKRKELEKIDKQLSENIFFMLNNLNIRHNNRSKSDKNYKAFVAKMQKKTLEKWYDELYQMMLLSILILDNKNNRESEIKQLKDKVNEGE